MLANDGGGDERNSSTGQRERERVRERTGIKGGREAGKGKKTRQRGAEEEHEGHGR